MVIDQCSKCSLVQMRNSVDQKILYGDYYWYKSNSNPIIVNNLCEIAELANDNTVPGDMVLDIGANDGTLLSAVDIDRYTVGCEPAKNFQAALKLTCNEVIDTFWHHTQLNGRKAKFITAIGMFYDIEDPNEFINSVAKSLSKTGIFIAQLMTLAPMLRSKDLGNICHEHLEYYTYKSLVELYERNNLEIFKVVENNIQGGSYQIWARHYNTGSIAYDEDLSSLNTFFVDVMSTGKKLQTLLQKYVDDGKKCYVYGASTKGNTLLQIWKLGKYFTGVAEIHQEKIGRFTVGTGIPIIDEAEARAKADVFFVPNFGFKEFFLEKEAKWLDDGGQMIFSMPTIDIVRRD